MDDIEFLRLRHPGWEISRRDGMIQCSTGKYVLVAGGVAEAGRGMTEWETQTGLTGGPGMSSDEFVARVTGAVPKVVAATVAVLIAAVALPSPSARARTPAIPAGAAIVQASRACILVAGGRPGVRTWKMLITRNPCGIPMRAAMECTQPGGMGSAYWVAGPVTRKVPSPGHPVISEADCGMVAPPLHIEPWEMEYSLTGRRPWHWAGIGPVPPRTNPVITGGTCTVKAHGRPGLETFTEYFDANPCYKVRAAVFCYVDMPPFPIKGWDYGRTVSGAPSYSRASCGSYSTMITWGFRWGTGPGLPDMEITTRPPFTASPYPG